jgi:hypothetical protein
MERWYRFSDPLKPPASCVSGATPGLYIQLEVTLLILPFLGVCLWHKALANRSLKLATCGCNRMISRRHGSDFGAILRDERGATAIEMAFVAPVFLMLLFGIIHSGLLLFTKANLQYAVQRHVRCLAIQLSCPSPTTHYFALGSTPVFTPTQLTHCQALTGTVSYDFSVLMVQRTVALSATACFPRIIDAAG